MSRPAWIPEDLRSYDRASFVHDLSSATAVAFLAIPQGIAYALIAGIPPVMGLYAATLPTIVGSLFRSSRHVITGPTNAVSLLVGAAIAQDLGGDPASIAITLAFMVALIQLAAGSLRLGIIVDYVSGPVVLGYITGAGTLIAVGQLPNLTGTEGTLGYIGHRIHFWVSGLGETDPVALAMALGTIAVILAFRRLHPRAPGVILATGLALALTVAFDLNESGLRVVQDLSPITAQLPPLSLPSFSLMAILVPHAFAVALLSMVESTSVARSIASRSGQRLNISREFIGEGLANLTASLVGGYPTTGSLSRSALNEREGGRTRLAGIYSGFLVILGLLIAGRWLNLVPIAALGGLLMVVAAGLVHRDQIRRVLNSHSGDRVAFLGTLLGTWFLHLDQAIYLGVGISLILFLRRARMLRARDLVVDQRGLPREVAISRRQEGPDGFHQPGLRYCNEIHVLSLSGALFFGAAGELQNVLDDVLAQPRIQVLVLRIRWSHSFDMTTADVLVQAARRCRESGRYLLLVGSSVRATRYLKRMGVEAAVGEGHLLARQPELWFGALAQAIERALGIVGEHRCGQECPWVGSFTSGDLGTSRPAAARDAR